MRKTKCENVSTFSSSVYARNAQQIQAGKTTSLARRACTHDPTTTSHRSPHFEARKHANCWSPKDATRVIGSCGQGPVATVKMYPTSNGLSTSEKKHTYTHIERSLHAPRITHLQVPHEFVTHIRNCSLCVCSGSMHRSRRQAETEEKEMTVTPKPERNDSGKKQIKPNPVKHLQGTRNTVKRTHTHFSKLT